MATLPLGQRVLHAAAASLFRYDAAQGQYDSQGPVAALIVGDDQSNFSLVCYQHGCEGREEAELCKAVVTRSNQGTKYTVQGDNYASFRDERAQQWSLYFRDEDSSRIFAKHWALAIWAAGGRQPRAVTVVELAKGRGELLDPGDACGVKFNGFAVSNSQLGLGAQYDTNTHSRRTYKFAVPQSNARLEAGMKGFEGTVAGMREGGRRVVIVPPACRAWAAGPPCGMQETLLFLIEVKKIRKARGAGPRDADSRDSDSLVSETTGLPTPAARFASDSSGPQFPPDATSPIAAGPLAAPPAPAAAQPVMAVAAPLPAAEPAPTSPQRSPPTLPHGLPPAQLRSLHNTESNVQQLVGCTADLVTTLQDLRGSVEGLGVDVRTMQQRQRPPTLTAAQAMQSLQALLEDTARAQEALKAKDQRIQELEEALERTRARADCFAASAQDLVDEQKAQHVDKSSQRIETERLVMRLEEEAARAAATSDDATRALKATQQRLIEAQDELQAAKGQLMVARVEAETNRKKYAESDEVLRAERLGRERAEERLREATAALAEVRDDDARKGMLLEERGRKAELDRQHLLRMLDDERQRSEDMHEQLRTDMLAELHARDSRQEQARVQAADQAFAKGVDHGREVAAAEARMKWQQEMRDVRIECGALRAKVESLQAELAVEKETSKGTIERLCSFQTGENGAELQSLTRHVASLQAQLGQVYERLAQRDADLAGARLAQSDAEQRLRDTEVRCTSSIVALSRQVVPKHALVGLLQQIFNGGHPDLSFELDDSLYGQSVPPPPPGSPPSAVSDAAALRQASMAAREADTLGERLGASLAAEEAAARTIQQQGEAAERAELGAAHRQGLGALAAVPSSPPPAAQSPATDPRPPSEGLSAGAEQPDGAEHDAAESAPQQAAPVGEAGAQRRRADSRRRRRGQRRDPAPAPRTAEALYDGTWYPVTVVVEDNGCGEAEVEWEDGSTSCLPACAVRAGAAEGAAPHRRRKSSTRRSRDPPAEQEQPAGDAPPAAEDPASPPAELQCGGGEALKRAKRKKRRAAEGEDQQQQQQQQDEQRAEVQSPAEETAAAAEPEEAPAPEPAAPPAEAPPAAPVAVGAKSRLFDDTSDDGGFAARRPAASLGVAVPAAAPPATVAPDPAPVRKKSLLFAADSDDSNDDDLILRALRKQ
eukprot:TRINITY_DN4783_c1_g2_i1.p1 TRINITY_DN4783_c1_g2~~TRINITY_DN4783_c1_g2_i1.p1  ORF type:complete len:1174 (+),score=431.59 TRINITY_DN4783_c1_g2_i1:75-3596(+)